MLLFINSTEAQSRDHTAKRNACRAARAGTARQLQCDFGHAGPTIVGRKSRRCDLGVGVCNDDDYDDHEHEHEHDVVCRRSHASMMQQQQPVSWRRGAARHSTNGRMNTCLRLYVPGRQAVDWPSKARLNFGRTNSIEFKAGIRRVDCVAQANSACPSNQTRWLARTEQRSYPIPFGSARGSLFTALDGIGFSANWRPSSSNPHDHHLHHVLFPDRRGRRHRPLCLSPLASRRLTTTTTLHMHPQTRPSAGKAKAMPSTVNTRLLLRSLVRNGKSRHNNSRDHQPAHLLDASLKLARTSLRLARRCLRGGTRRHLKFQPQRISVVGE